MAVDEARVQAMIAEALKEDGAIYAAVKAQIQAETSPSGLIAVCAQSTVDATVGKMDAIEAQLDKEFPFRKYARDCNPQEWALAWKRMLVDKEYLASLADQMGDAAVANTLTAWATNRDDPELTKLKDAVALKNAPKTSWKQLCLPSHGGGPDKFRSFMMERADDADATVPCIARRCLSLYGLLEKRFTSPMSSKKTSSSKIDGQKADLMELVYNTVKFMKNKARKSAARNTVESLLLERDFSQELQMGLAKTVLSRNTTPVKLKRSLLQREGSGAAYEPPVKAPRYTAPFAGGGKDGGKGSKGGGRGDLANSASGSGNKNEVYAALEVQLDKMSKAKDRAALQRFMDDTFGSDDQTKRSAIGAVIGKACRNCLMGGRGIQHHRVSDCQGLGNPPSDPCPICASAGHILYHWKNACNRQTKK